jgi:hypothetical protein
MNREFQGISNSTDRFRPACRRISQTDYAMSGLLPIGASPQLLHLLRELPHHLCKPGPLGR